MPEDIGSSLGAAGGEIAGNAVGGEAGGQIGKGVGKVLGGLFHGSGTPMGGGQFDGLHSRTLPPLAASSMKGPEAGIYAAYATGLGISVEEVDLLIEQDARMHGGVHLKNIPGGTTDAWRNTNLDNARIYLRAYNAQHPGSPIIEGSLYNQGGPAGGPPTGRGAIAPQQYQQQQYVAPATAPAPAPAAGLTLPNVNIQTGGNTPPAAPNYALYGGIGAGALVLLLVLVIILKKKE